MVLRIVSRFYVDGVVVWFFEELRTDEEKDVGTPEDPGLDDLPQDHEIFDNPLSAVNGRTKEDVISFLEVLEKIVKIKEGESEIFKNLFILLNHIFKTMSKRKNLNL